MEHFTVSAPGKLILHGEHSVVYGHKAIACALNLRCFVDMTVHNPKDELLSVFLEDLKTSVCFSKQEWTKIQQELTCANSDEYKLDLCGQFVSEKCLSFDTSASLKTAVHMALVSFIYLNFLVFDKFVPLKIRVHSDIPVGAGLGSSAAFSVALSVAFLVVAKRLSLGSTKWTKKDLDIISDMAFKSETIMHGKPSGIDNSISTYGGAIVFQNGDIKSTPKFPELKALLVHTKVPRSTKDIVSAVKKRFDANPEKYNAIFTEINDIVRIVEEAYCSETPKKVDFLELSQLIKRNHALLKSMEVSHASIEEICSLFEEAGVPGKLTGAGAGGCVFGLLPYDLSETERHILETRLHSDLHKRGFGVWVTSVGAKGVRVEPTTS